MTKDERLKWGQWLKKTGRKTRLWTLLPKPWNKSLFTGFEGQAFNNMVQFSLFCHSILHDRRNTAVSGSQYVIRRVLITETYAGKCYMGLMFLLSCDL